MLIFCDFIQVYVFSTNHHLKGKNLHQEKGSIAYKTSQGKIKKQSNCFPKTCVQSPLKKYKLALVS